MFPLNGLPDKKFLGGAFGFDGVVSLLAFAALIVIYTAIGGFRGSVYVDSMQAIIRVIGTFIAMGLGNRCCPRFKCLLAKHQSCRP